jgi:hypothetical protein
MALRYRSSINNLAAPSVIPSRSPGIDDVLLARMACGVVDHLVEPAEDRGLLVLVLDHRLDDDLAVGQVAANRC